MIGFDLMKVLLPLYAVGIVLTVLSTEEFVNVGWDSAGVTTGTVTACHWSSRWVWASVTRSPRWKGLGFCLSRVSVRSLRCSRWVSLSGQGVNGPARRRSCLRVRKEKRYVSQKRNVTI